MSVCCKVKGNLLQTLLLHQNCCRLFSISLIKLSLYPKTALEPIISKETLSKPLDPNDPRRFQLIKAARTEQTTTFYYDPVVQKFCNRMMTDGRKDAARRTLDETFANIKRIQLEKFHKCKTEEEKSQIILDPVEILHKAVENCKPILMIQEIAKGGVQYQVPVPCPVPKQTFFSMKWLIESCKKVEKQKRMRVKLAHELVDASNNEGKAIRKKQELYKMCEENRAYAHFRWSKG